MQCSFLSFLSNIRFLNKLYKVKFVFNFMAVKTPLYMHLLLVNYYQMRDSSLFKQ